MNSGIYIIRNLINNKIYVGSTKNFYKRKIRHFRDLNDKKHHNISLTNAVNKYGLENFSFEIVEEVPYEKELIINKEQEYIDDLDAKTDGYNIGDASFGDTISLHPNKKEICDKISIKKLGKPGHKHTNEHKEYLSNLYTGEGNPNYNKPCPDHVRQKVSEINRGVPTSEYQKRRVSEANKGNKSRKGMKNSKEMNNKLSKALKGRQAPNAKTIKIKGTIYYSLKEARKALKTTKEYIKSRIADKSDNEFEEL
jgi:group I intron endonuclease